jgi:predicted RND superfamily exporter protein/lauroyl/myristoyl acyltransferase
MSFLKRWWWVILLVAIGLGFCRLRFDVDVLNLLPPEEPSVQGLKLYERHFTNARELVISLRAQSAEQAQQLAVKLADRLRQETNLVEEVTWQPPWMEHPEQLGELLGWLWFNQSPESFAALTNRLAQSNLTNVLDETKEALSTSMSPMDLAKLEYDPYNLMSLPALSNLSSFSSGQSQQMFASTDGQFRVLYVESAVDLGGYTQCESWLKQIRGIVDGLKNGNDWNGVTIRYTGRPVFVEEVANSMQHDMSHSIGITSTVIAVLFFLMHRRLRPMAWLIALLMMILVATLALGALLMGAINIVSMGFAAVLLGLAVDYAVVHYQEALAHPQMSVPEIRRAIAPSILWAAITTITAFLVLNLGGLPGLGQLGTLVAIGIALSAWVMVMIYLPPLFPSRRKPPANLPPFRWWNYFVAPHEPFVAGIAKRGSYGGVMLLTIVILLAAFGALCFKRPGLDHSADALHPKNSEAQSALDEMTAQLGLPRQPLWLIISGRDEPEVYNRIVKANSLLNDAQSNHLVGQFLLPSALWPRAEFQAANRQTAAELGKRGMMLNDATLSAGFNTNATVLTKEIVRTWARAGESTNTIWPTNYVSQWLLRRFVTRTTDQILVVGLVYPATNNVDMAALGDLSHRLAEGGAMLSGWDLLGSTTLKRVQSHMWQVVTPMIALVLLSLWFAFRRPTEILLGAAVLCMSGVCLLAIMGLAGWKWNLMNMMALPLMLGTGVDYTIFIQLALRRHGGDLVAVRHSVGRALMLCGATAMTGFGTLGLSSNPGMASLGWVCAIGIGANMLISVFLLPTWWLLTRKSHTDGSAAPPASGKTSIATPAFYRGGMWKFGLKAAQIFPAAFLKKIASSLAGFYLRFQPRGVNVVLKNFLPLFNGDRSAAEKAVRAMHKNFATKLVDLWRVEGGEQVTSWLTNDSELEIIRAAQKRGRGIVFITLHLGNWEHGGLLLKQLGFQLTILSLAEPDDGLTELRNQARARYGVNTLIIGEGDFAFVEVIKQLQSGANLALSLDRPPERGVGVPIKFFGQTFEASPAAAELARASGCALIGVTIVRRPNGFAVKVLPEFAYDRRALGSREVRIELTQQILRAFEPEIRQNIEQWYQFTPIWAAGS